MILIANLQILYYTAHLMIVRHFRNNFYQYKNI